MPKQKKHERLAIVRDSDQPCIDRGKAIDELLDSGMLQVEIASETGMSTGSVSHLRKVSRNLKAPARQLCQSGRMNADACYTLAGVDAAEQARVLKRAAELRTDKDERRYASAKKIKGRQTLRGQVTDKDVKDAIRELGIR